MRKVKVLTIVALLYSFTVMAQQHPGKPNPKEMAKQTVSEFVKKINISPAIQDTLQTVFIEFYTNMEKEHKSGSRPEMNKEQKSGEGYNMNKNQKQSKGQGMDKMKKLEDIRDLKVKSFLTDKQFKAYQKFMEEQKAKRGGPDGNGQKPERPDKE